MKVVLSTLGKFHSFDLARQLHAHGALQAIYSGYPRFKLRSEGLPADLIRTFPYLHTPYMAAGWRDRFGLGLLRQWEYWDRTTLDTYAARTLPQADLFVGLSGCGLATGRVAKRRGMKYVCDRGSTHIRHQDEVVRAEHERWGLPFVGIDPRIIAREEAEYDSADLVTVPSTCVRDSFLARGVDLERFFPTGTPDTQSFDVLFVGAFSLRKGVPYLLQAWKALRHPRKTLTFAGGVEPAVVERLRALDLLPDEVRFLGHVPQPELKDLMSRSHVLVLPSLEEGLAMVMAQALACGCPVIASRMTGAQDLFSDGAQGYIVAPGSTEELTDRLQAVADDPALRARLGSAALTRVRAIGGWSTYGENARRLYGQLIDAPAANPSRLEREPA
jgi:glycosyltransferase involved in cell wall biosynthesis